VSTSTDPEAYLLAECPVCDYALQGLPVEHLCPECGLAFDRRWWVYGGPGVSREWSRSARAFQIVTAIACVIVICLFLIKQLPMSAILVGVSMVILAAVGLAYLFSTYRPRRFIALGPAALVVFHGPKRIEHFPWSTISHPRADMHHKCVVFESAGKTIRVKGYDFFGGVIYDVERCARGITQYTRDLESYPA